MLFRPTNTTKDGSLPQRPLEFVADLTIPDTGIGTLLFGSHKGWVTGTVSGKRLISVNSGRYDGAPYEEIEVPYLTNAVYEKD